jgi:hypothetical protein
MSLYAQTLIPPAKPIQKQTIHGFSFIYPDDPRFDDLRREAGWDDAAWKRYKKVEQSVCFITFSGEGEVSNIRWTWGSGTKRKNALNMTHLMKPLFNAESFTAKNISPHKLKWVSPWYLLIGGGMYPAPMGPGDEAVQEIRFDPGVPRMEAVVYSDGRGYGNKADVENYRDVAEGFKDFHREIEGMNLIDSVAHAKQHQIQAMRPSTLVKQHNISYNRAIGRSIAATRFLTEYDPNFGLRPGQKPDIEKFTLKLRAEQARLRTLPEVTYQGDFQ